MTRKRFWTLAALALLTVAALAAWKLRPTQPPAAATPPATASPPTLELADSDLLRAQRQTLTRAVAVTGSLKATQTAFVKAKVAGELQRLTVREGDTVRAGQVLAQIDPTDLQLRLRQAQQQAEAARAQLDIAERSLANNQALVQQGFISTTALQTAQATAAGARATVQAAQAAAALAQKSLADATVTAPISGLVAQRLVQPGERVALDARLLEIVNPSQLELEVPVPPEDVAALRVGATASLQVEGHPQPVAARVLRINPSASSGARTVPAYLGVAPTPGLRQGLFAQGVIALTQRETLVLPVAAVRLDAAQPYALLVQAGRVQKRVLGLGQRGRTGLGGATLGAEAVEVLSGLADGDLVLGPNVGAVAEGTPVRLPQGTSPAAAAGSGTAPGAVPSAPSTNAAPAAPASAAR